MPITQDTEEGWQITYPDEKKGGPYKKDIVEKGPWVQDLSDREKTTYNPVVLHVDYEASNAVTITWRADDEVLLRKMDRVRSSETSLKLSTRWLKNHPNSTYKVTVKDQKMGRRYAINPMSSSCTVSIDPYY